VFDAAERRRDEGTTVGQKAHSGVWLFAEAGRDVDSRRSDGIHL
jgi:hypothetical protein